MKITLTQLTYVCAVAEHLHFSHAANACYVTQSTLSAGINTFEKSIGKNIFERSNKQVLITAAGVEIVARAKEILSSVESLLDYSAMVAPPLSGKLIIGAIPTIGPFLFSRFLPELRESYPDLKLYLKERHTQLLLDDLASGNLDAAIIALPYPIKNMEVLPLFDEEFYFACHHQHDLASKKKIRINQVDAGELLLLEDGNCIRDHALAACRLKSDEHAPFEGTSLPTLVEMVANDLGVTLIPDMALSSGMLRQPNVKFIPFKEKGVGRSIVLVHRKSSVKSDDLKVFASKIIQSV